MATIQMKVQPEDLSQVPRGNERIPDPVIMTIFGASGDLTKRKLLPALFHLEQNGLLPAKFAIVGVARRPLGDEFAADMRAGHRRVRRRRRHRSQARRLHEEDQLLRAQLRRPGALRRPERRTGAHRQRGRHRASTGSSISPLRPSSLPASSKTWARRDGSARKGPRRRGHREALRPRPRLRRASSITR